MSEVTVPGLVTLADLTRDVSAGKAHRGAPLLTAEPESRTDCAPRICLSTLTYLPHRRALCSTLPAANIGQEAVGAYIGARAGSTLKATAYSRERCVCCSGCNTRMPRQDALADMLQKDGDDYIAFLQAIPAQWILGVRPHLGAPGWVSFHGPFSRLPSCVVVASLTWPKSAEYLHVGQSKAGGDQQTQPRDTKAEGEGLRSIPAAAPCHSRTHVRFIRRFLEGVGIRSA